MSPRRRAALAFGAAGALAAAVHVLTETPGELRDWRQTLPLATLVGAALGAALRPVGWRAGLAAGFGGLVAFMAAFALGHGMIAAAQGGAFVNQALQALGRMLAVVLGPTGLATAALAAAAGAALRRSGR